MLFRGEHITSVQVAKFSVPLQYGHTVQADADAQSRSCGF